jgi:hypothetical protein
VRSVISVQDDSQHQREAARERDPPRPGDHGARACDRPEGLNGADYQGRVYPILSDLGWELQDPFSVSQQYRHK